jgi:hypothetical protein
VKLMAGAMGVLKGVSWHHYHYPWLLDASSPARVVPGFLALEPLGRKWAAYWGLGWGLAAMGLWGWWGAWRGKAGSMGRALAPWTAAQWLNSAYLGLTRQYFFMARSMAYGFALSLPLLAAAARGRRPSRLAVGLLLAFAAVQIGWAAGQAASARDGGLNTPRFPTHLDTKERELGYDWRPLVEAAEARPGAVLALDLRQPWVQERAEHVFASRPFWRTTALNQYHTGRRADGLRMPKPAGIELALVEKRVYPAGPKGGVLLAQTPELALYEFRAPGIFTPAPEALP